MSGLPLRQRKHDSIWVIVDRLITSAHFIPVRIDYSLDRLAKLYVDEFLCDCMVCLYLLCQIEICDLHRGSRRNYN